MDAEREWIAGYTEGRPELEPASNPDGEADVWRVCVGGRPVAFFKRHRSSDKWHRERWMLRRLADLDTAVAIPTVLADREAPRWLLLSALPGVVASTATFDLDQRRALHEAAGRFRRDLDRLPMGEPDPLPLPEALTRRYRSWSKQARSTLEPELLQSLERAFDPTVFDRDARRWCHRDLAPHNWVVAASADGIRLGVIDFGQARPDAWLVDIVKLWSDVWVSAPDLSASFWAGYGRRPTDHEQAQFRQLALLHGLATATWGDRHTHTHFSRHGRATLRRALDPRPRSPCG
ncbi:MAG: aminoglycoside phosphotransferase family protein [Myxococcota bacterium]